MKKNKKQYKIKTIVIDPGHGGKDPGAIGSFSMEKNVALTVSLQLGDLIEKNIPNVKIIYTRNKDEFVELYKRAELANKEKADLFISIHCNAIAKQARNKVYGTETYVMGTHVSSENLDVAKRENSVILLEEGYEENYGGFNPNSPQSHILLSLYQNAHLENSLELAKNIEDQFKNRVRRYSRGVKQAGFVVLRRTAMPSVLVEIGFISNPQEEKFINDKLGQTLIASGIYRAFRDYKNELESL